MTVLSCFIDESGLAEWQPHSPYYLVSLVFHEQDKPISGQLANLEAVLANRGLGQGFIHARPLMRSDDPYRDMPLPDRRYVFSQLFLFAKKCDISYRALLFNRKECRTLEELDNRIGRGLRSLLIENAGYFKGFERIVVYYDDGQKHLSKIVTDGFSVQLGSLDRRHIKPEDYRKYRLAQVADMVCCLELTAARIDDNLAGRNEVAFFESAREFKKAYLKPLRRKLL